MPEIVKLSRVNQSRIFTGLFYLLSIVIVIMLIKVLGSLIMFFPSVSPDVWAMSSPQHKSYHSLMKLFLLFELASRAALLCGGSLVAYALARKHHYAPARITMFLVAYLGTLIVEQSMTYVMIKQQYGQFLQPGWWHPFVTKEFLFVIANCLVWPPLFVRSSQMKELFMRA